jgi:type IV pilus assembly protein PilC
MPRFNYTAMDGRGKEQKGKIEAESEQEAVAQLKQKGLFPTSMTAGKGAKAKAAAGPKKAGGGGGFNISIGTPSLKLKTLCTFTRQLATLLDAGLPLVRSLHTLEKQAKKDPILKKIVLELAASVEGGGTFSEALSAHPKTFTKLYINMVRAGEASGAMETVLNRLAEFMEKAQRIAGKVKSAMVYPCVVLGVSLTIAGGLMIFIVPKFAKIFDEMLPGEPLPGLTNMLIGTSNFLKDKFLVLVGIVGALVFAFKMFKKTKVGSFVLDVVAMKLPPLNQLTIKTVVARFCRTLGTLMQSGVGVLQALQIVRDTSGNEVVARAIQSVHDAVKDGEGMSKPLEAANVFPGMVVSMIEVGEETGALPEMLARIADNYEEEVDQAVDALTSMIEPIMIVFLAVVVGGIVIGLFLPLVKLIDQLGG